MEVTCLAHGVVGPDMHDRGNRVIAHQQHEMAVVRVQRQCVINKETGHCVQDSACTDALNLHAVRCAPIDGCETSTVLPTRDLDLCTPLVSLREAHCMVVCITPGIDQAQ